MVNSGHSGGPGALSLADGTAAATSRRDCPPRRDPGSGTVQGVLPPIKASSPSTCAPLLSSCEGSPWDAEAVGARRAGHPRAETLSSALLAFPGIIGEKTLFFPLLQKMPKAKNSFMKLLLY